MTDAAREPGPFVSYAREDQPFVRKLHEALGRRHRDTWVDWEGIYPTEEWMARIRSAIDSAHAFVFVISPSSVASAVCAQEIDHAAAQNKRLIPIVFRDVDAASVHPALARLNWIHIRDGDDFEQKVDELLAAMDLDLDWLRGHTRLLVRAEEWQKRGREGSVLLRGNDLRQAERWLLQVAPKREPTPLQTQFIVASRQSETRRRKVVGAITTATSIVLALLAVYSWVKKSEAERNLNDAISRQLAIRASSIDEERNLSRLLVSALATRYSHTTEADAILARSLLPTVPLRTALWSECRKEPMDCISFHRDGAFVAASNMHCVTVWSTATGRMEASLSSEDGVDCVAFGPSESLLAVSDEGRVMLWDWREDHRRVLGPEPNQDTTRSAFSADGRSVFVASAGRVVKWDLESASSRVLLEADPPTDLVFAFSPDGARMAYADALQRVFVWDLVAEKPLAEVQGPSGAGVELAFSADGSTLAAGRDTVVVWDLTASGAQQVNELEGDQLEEVVVATSLAFSADAETLFVGGVDSAILQWDFRQRSRRHSLHGSVNGTGSLAGSPDGGLLATNGEVGSVWLLEPSKQFERILEKRVSVELVSESVSPDGRMLTLKRGEGYVLWDPSGARPPLRMVNLPVDPAAVRFGQRGRLLAVLDREGRIGLWNTDNGRPVEPPEEMQASWAERIDVSATGEAVAAVDIDGSVNVWDLSKGAHWSRDAAATGHARSVAFSRDGKLLASGNLEGVIHLWSADSGEHQRELPPSEEGNVLALAFSPDGRGLAASVRGVIAIWDLEDNDIRRNLRGHDGSVPTLAFSPDGRWLASGSLDKTAIVWDPLSGEAILKITDETNPAEVLGVAFGVDGKTLATRYRTTAVSLWNLDTEHWTDLACSIVNRNLTREEWETYLPSMPYRKACPELPESGTP